jgi:hypothetical protein
MLTKIAATALLLGLSGVALAQNATNDSAPLVSVGNNVQWCSGWNNQGGSFAPGLGNKGVAVVHYNPQKYRFSVNVSVHDAQPNTTYDVDIRCWVFGPQHAIGQLTTNKQGTGTFQIDLSLDKVEAMGNFYIDIAVPAQPGGPGAGGYGDTYIAGPLNLLQ